MVNIMLEWAFGFNLFKINLNKLGRLKLVEYLCQIEFDYAEIARNLFFSHIFFPPKFWDYQ